MADGSRRFDPLPDIILEDSKPLPKPATPQKREPSRIGDTSFGRSLESGIAQLEAGVRGTAAAVGEVVGAEEFSQDQAEKAARAHERAAYLAPPVQNFSDVETGTDLINYTVGLFGQQAPLIPALAAGGPAALGARALAGRLGIGAARNLSTQATVAGGLSGAGASVEIGSTFNRALEDPEITANNSRRDIALTSIGTGSLGGIAEGLPLLVAADRLGLGRSVRRDIQRGLGQRVLRATGAQAAAEAPTEATQAVLERSALKLLNDNFEVFDEEGRTEILDSAVAGAIVGGGFGALTGIPNPGGRTSLDDKLADLEVEDEQRSNITTRARRDMSQFPGFADEASGISDTLGLGDENAVRFSRKFVVPRSSQIADARENLEQIAAAEATGNTGRSVSERERLFQDNVRRIEELRRLEEEAEGERFDFTGHLGPADNEFRTLATMFVARNAVDASVIKPIHVRAIKAIAEGDIPLTPELESKLAPLFPFYSDGESAFRDIVDGLGRQLGVDQQQDIGDTIFDIESEETFEGEEVIPDEFQLNEVAPGEVEFADVNRRGLSNETILKQIGALRSEFTARPDKLNAVGKAARDINRDPTVDLDARSVSAFDLLVDHKRNEVGLIGPELEAALDKAGQDQLTAALNKAKNNPSRQRTLQELFDRGGRPADFLKHFEVLAKTRIPAQLKPLGTFDFTQAELDNVITGDKFVTEQSGQVRRGNVTRDQVPLTTPGKNVHLPRLVKTALRKANPNANINNASLEEIGTALREGLTSILTTEATELNPEFKDIRARVRALRKELGIKSGRKVINPDVDSLLTAIMKSGGLSIEEGRSMGFDEEQLKTKVSNRRVFKEDGDTFEGMSEQLGQLGYRVTNETGSFSESEMADVLHDALNGDIDSGASPEFIVNQEKLSELEDLEDLMQATPKEVGRGGRLLVNEIPLNKIVMYRNFGDTSVPVTFAEVARSGRFRAEDVLNSLQYEKLRLPADIADMEALPAPTSGQRTRLTKLRQRQGVIDNEIARATEEVKRVQEEETVDELESRIALEDERERAITGVVEETGIIADPQGAPDIDPFDVPTFDAYRFRPQEKTDTEPKVGRAQRRSEEAYVREMSQLFNINIKLRHATFPPNSMTFGESDSNNNTITIDANITDKALRIETIAHEIGHLVKERLANRVLTVKETELFDEMERSFREWRLLNSKASLHVNNVIKSKRPFKTAMATLIQDPKAEVGSNAEHLTQRLFEVHDRIESWRGFMREEKFREQPEARKERIRKGIDQLTQELQSINSLLLIDETYNVNDATMDKLLQRVQFLQIRNAQAANADLQNPEVYFDGVLADARIEPVLAEIQRIATERNIKAKEPTLLSDLSREDQEYLLDFHEWFADQTARWATTRAKPISIMEKAFKQFAEALKEIFRRAFRKGYQPNKSFENFLDEVLKTEAQQLEMHNLSFQRAKEMLPKSVRDSRKIIIASGVAEENIFSKASFVELNKIFAEELNPEERNTLMQAFSKGSVRVQMLKKIDDPALRERVKRSPSIAAVTGYQLWAAGELKPGPQTESLYESMATYMTETMGVVRQHKQAEQIMQAIRNGNIRARNLNKGEFAVERRVDNTKTKRAFARVEKSAETIAPYMSATFSSASARIRSFDNAALDKLVKMFYNAPGDTFNPGTYFEARTIQYGNWANKSARALDKLNDKQLEEVSVGLKTPRQFKSKDPLVKQALAQQRKIFAEMLVYARKAGLELGDKSEKLADGQVNYFPRVYDVSRLSKNSDKFREMLLTKYNEQLTYIGRPREITIEGRKGEAPRKIKRKQIPPERIADSIIDSLTRADGYGDIDLNPTLESHVPFAASLNKRTLDFIADEDIEPYVLDDVRQTILTYITQMVKRAEFVRRFGPEGEVIKRGLENAVGSGATDEQIRTAEAFIEAMQGTYGVDFDDNFRKWVKKARTQVREDGKVDRFLAKLEQFDSSTFNSIVVTWQNIRLLGLATFSSLIDLMGPALRGDLNSAWTGYTQGMSAFLDEQFNRKPGERKGDMVELAETLGIINENLTNQALSWEFGTVHMSQKARKINDTFFKWTGLTHWTRMTRLMATASAEAWLARHVTNPTNNSERWLAELNLTKEDVKLKDGRIQFLSRTERNNLLSQEGADAKAELERDDRVRFAMVRWVDGAILRPNAAQRPIWASSPAWQLMFHLKGFMYSAHETWLKRVASEAGQGNYMPMVYLMGMVPIMAASDWLRDRIQNWGSPAPRKENWGMSDHIWDSVQRAGVLGTGQLILDMEKDARYNGVDSVLDFNSPSGDQMGLFHDLIDEDTGSSQRLEAFYKSLPLQNVWRNWPFFQPDE